MWENESKSMYKGKMRALNKQRVKMEMREEERWKNGSIAGQKGKIRAEIRERT